MGAFSNVDYELQNNEAAVSNAFMEDDAMDMPQAAPAEPATGKFPAGHRTGSGQQRSANRRPSLTPKVRTRPAVRTKRLKLSARQNGTPNGQKSSGRNRLHWKSWMP